MIYSIKLDSYVGWLMSSGLVSFSSEHEHIEVTARSDLNIFTRVPLLSCLCIMLHLIDCKIDCLHAAIVEFLKCNVDTDVQILWLHG